MGRWALVTGASSGLGRDFAKLFAKDGHDVIAVARRQDRLDELKTELSQTHGVQTHVVAADLSDPAAPPRIFEDVMQAGFEVEYLVNNAGFGTQGPFAELPLDRELAMLQVNIASLVHLTGLFLPAMLDRKTGRILNVASTAGFQPGPLMATYYASKAFVVSWSEALWFELRDTGVAVTTSCPGATATEFAATAGNDRTPLFRSGVASSDDVAKEAYAAMKNGQRLVVHGAKNRMLAVGVRWMPRQSILGVTAKLNTAGSSSDTSS